MTIVRLGYVAISMELKNASPSKTMTFSYFQKQEDREAAIRKLERIALENLENWEDDWDRVVQTWKASPFPIKMHISSPKSEPKFRHHADTVDVEMFFRFLNEIKGSVPQIDCMIEAKLKDKALFTLVEQIKNREDVEMIDGSSFYLLS